MENSLVLAGTVHNGVVVLSGGQTLPEGASVEVVVRREPDANHSQPTPPSVWSDLARLGREVESLPCDLPEDLAINHDHYLYGVPKRQ